MKRNSMGVAGDEGVAEQERRGFRLYRLMSVLWLFPVSAAVTIFVVGDWEWVREPTLEERFRAIPLEQWVAWIILAIYPWICLRARREA